MNTNVLSNHKMSLTATLIKDFDKPLTCDHIVVLVAHLGIIVVDLVSAATIKVQKH